MESVALVEPAARSCAGAAQAAPRNCESLRNNVEGMQRTTCTCNGTVAEGKQPCPTTPAQSTACVCSSGAGAISTTTSLVTVNNCFGKRISFINAEYVSAGGTTMCTTKA